LNLIGEIFIIDNYSTDKSIESIQGLSKIRIILNKENIGFGAACNQAIALSNAPYMVMINPDVLVYENTIEESFNFMEANTSIEILGAMQYDELGNIRPSCARFPTAIRFFNEATGLSKIFPKIFYPPTLMTDWSHTYSKNVDQIIGSYMFIRRSVFEKIGVFDPLFFVYYEELDLSKRLKDAGGISFYNHNIKLLHYGEGTTKNIKAYRLYLNLNSRLLYARKHFRRFGFILTYFSTLFIEPTTRVVFLLFQRKFDDINSTFSGFKKLWKEWKVVSFSIFSSK
jgi:GT2 family glycosyltransferase